MEEDSHGHPAKNILWPGPALIPLAIILDKIGGVPQPLLFFLTAVAIFPLAALLVHATEQLATYTGDTIGGLRHFDLNIRFTGLLLLAVRLIMAMAFFQVRLNYDFGGKSGQLAAE